MLLSDTLSLAFNLPRLIFEASRHAMKQAPRTMLLDALLAAPPFAARKVCFHASLVCFSPYPTPVILETILPFLCFCLFSFDLLLFRG